MRWVVLIFVLAGCAHSAPSSARSAELKAINEYFVANSTSIDMAERVQLEWKLAQALERAELLNLAFIYTVPVAKAQLHPHHAEALATLVRLQERRQDDFLIPSIFNNFVSSGMPLGLSAEDAARVSWMRARIAFRKGQLQEAVSLCAAVPSTSPVFERAEYVRAIALSDARLNSAAGIGEASSILERLAAQHRDEKVKEQATLALARLAYGQKRWADARRWYQEAAKVDSTRGVALVEQGWVSIQLRDWKAAAWSESREEAQLSGLFEAPLIEALAAHFSGDTWEAESAILRAQKWDGSPSTDWTQQPPARALDALTTERGLSVAQLKRLRSNQRLMGLVTMIAAFNSELETVKQAPELNKPVANELATYLTQNIEVLRQTAGMTAQRELVALQAEKQLAIDSSWMLGVEVALARKHIAVVILRLEHLIETLPKGSAGSSELWFRLAAVQQAAAEVLKGADAEEAKAAVAESIKHVLEGDPSYERIEEARRFLTAE